jgi:hypothetical protein
MALVPARNSFTEQGETGLHKAPAGFWQRVLYVVVSPKGFTAVSW